MGNGANETFSHWFLPGYGNNDVQLSNCKEMRAEKLVYTWVTSRKHP